MDSGVYVPNMQETWTFPTQLPRTALHILQWEVFKGRRSARYGGDMVLVPCACFAIAIGCIVTLAVDGFASVINELRRI